MSRSESLAKVLPEAAQIASLTLERDVEAQGRSLFFKASLAWTLIRLHDVAQGGEISMKVDTFAAEQNHPKAACIDPAKTDDERRRDALASRPWFKACSGAGNTRPKRCNK